MRNKKSAFSLIEISIVVLIIGILIAGITQSSRLISSSKTSTAQTLTQSSPVSANKGLMLWLETSTDASFVTTEASDNENISRWNDINSQTVSKLYALPAAGGGATDAIKYKAVSTIGGLPSLYFDGTAGLALSSSTASIVAAPIFTEGASEFTFFTVARENSNGAKYVFYNGTKGTNGWGFGDNGTLEVISASADHTGGSYNTNPVIHSGSFDSTTLKLFNNGTAVTLSSTSPTIVTPTGNFFVGTTDVAGANAWAGYISEIIIYNHALQDSDRQSVEQYLGKKYGIIVKQ